MVSQDCKLVLEALFAAFPALQMIDDFSGVSFYAQPLECHE